MGQPSKVHQLQSAPVVPISAGSGGSNLVGGSGVGVAIGGMLPVSQSSLAEGASGGASAEGIQLVQQYSAGTGRPPWPGYLCGPPLTALTQQQQLQQQLQHQHQQEGRQRLVDASMQMVASGGRVGGEGLATQVSGGGTSGPGGSYRENAESKQHQQQPQQGYSQGIVAIDKQQQQQAWGSPNPSSAVGSCSAEEAELLVAAADAGRRTAAACQSASSPFERTAAVLAKDGNHFGDGGGEKSPLSTAAIAGKATATAPQTSRTAGEGNGAWSSSPADRSATSGKSRTEHVGGPRETKMYVAASVPGGGNIHEGAGRDVTAAGDDVNRSSNKEGTASRFNGAPTPPTATERYLPTNGGGGGPSNGIFLADDQRQPPQVVRGGGYPSRECVANDEDRSSSRGVKGGGGGGGSSGMRSPSPSASSDVEFVRHVKGKQHQHRQQSSPSRKAMQTSVASSQSEPDK